MKRIVALLMMLLLPFQMTLAAVVAIEMTVPSAVMQMGDDGACHHDAGSTAGDDAAATGHVGHEQCGVCHFSCCSALPTTAVAPPSLPSGEAPRAVALPAPPTPPAARPERPKWGRLA